MSTLFAAANLAVGYTFSTIAENQLQAVQMTFFFFLPNILLSGFMFPFRGMPEWAQAIGEALPLTHFLRIVRGITLKGIGFADMQIDVLALVIFMAGRDGARAVPLPPHAGLACACRRAPARNVVERASMEAMCAGLHLSWERFVSPFSRGARLHVESQHVARVMQRR